MPSFNLDVDPKEEAKRAKEARRVAKAAAQDEAKRAKEVATRAKSAAAAEKKTASRSADAQKSAKHEAEKRERAKDDASVDAWDDLSAAAAHAEMMDDDATLEPTAEELEEEEQDRQVRNQRVFPSRFRLASSRSLDSVPTSGRARAPFFLSLSLSKRTGSRRSTNNARRDVAQVRFIQRAFRFRRSTASFRRRSIDICVFDVLEKLERSISSFSRDRRSRRLVRELIIANLTKEYDVASEKFFYRNKRKAPRHHRESFVFSPCSRVWFLFL